MRVINLSSEGRGYVSEFMDTQTGVFHEEAFRHLLTREAGRATRYQDFFSICVLRPDVPGIDREQMGREVERAISEKIPEFVRATDLVGQLSSAIAVILLHTAGADALRVAERIRANIGQVAFREGPEGRPQRLTVSVGKVSFPHDGHTDSILLSQAMAYLAQAVERGGNQVTHSSGNPE
ncbi:MAG TPA: diguanylate cyclase [Gemmatimonadales bacterium]|jgi:diguanylate cyclase (GGDEF)-like protein